MTSKLWTLFLLGLSVLTISCRAEHLDLPQRDISASSLVPDSGWVAPPPLKAFDDDALNSPMYLNMPGFEPLPFRAPEEDASASSGAGPTDAVLASPEEKRIVSIYDPDSFASFPRAVVPIVRKSTLQVEPKDRPVEDLGENTEALEEELKLLETNIAREAAAP